MASSAATIVAAICVNSISLRRSHASATTPLIIEKTMIGNTRTRPTMPSASPFRSGGTSSDTCHSSPAFCIIEPEKETKQADPEQPVVAMLQRDERLAREQDQKCPRIACGWYGASSNAISSASSRMASAADRVVQVRHLRGADDRRGDARLREQPGQRDLRRLDAAPGGELDRPARRS